MSVQRLRPTASWAEFALIVFVLAVVLLLFFLMLFARTSPGALLM